MIIELLDKPTLVLINKILKYPLAVAEKDYFLAIVSKIIYESSLKDKLIFKGGTALYHTYLPQLRFSEDLDFSSNQNSMSLDEIKTIFAPYDFLSVKKEYQSKATVKIERLLFTGPLGQANSLKVEIDFLQNVVLPAREMDYHNAYGVETKVRVMDIKEIAAEKIRAMNDRVRYRDFYDFVMIGKKLDINLKEVVALVRQKEVRKPISPQTILSNWQLAKKDKHNELTAIHYSEELLDENVEAQLKRLPFSEISQRNGFITLISVLVVGAVGIAIALSLLLLGVGNSRTSFAVEQSNQAKALANSCAEEALQQIRDSTSYTGSGSLTLGQGTCNYTVTSQGGQSRTITVTGTVGTIFRKVKIIINNITPAISVTSWQSTVN